MTQTSSARPRWSQIRCRFLPLIFFPLSRHRDNGKKINGRKRHPVVDMRGMRLTVVVAPATNRDDRPARDLLFRLRLVHPEVTVVWADSAYAGELVRWSKSFLGITLHPVPRRKDQEGFAVLAERRRVERAFSWVMRARRNVRDYERTAPHPVERETAGTPKPIRIRQPHTVHLAPAALS
ncbi:transposase [Streptomyces sp. WAC 06783]|uniref:transposase n=1 Tax=Streptomyces sp. WAC 06783 TaxID=2203211 RepID=UPI00163BFE12|nr:transposase [Streptomyces sp. WAC 06783]